MSDKYGKVAQVIGPVVGLAHTGATKQADLSAL